MREAGSGFREPNEFRELGEAHVAANLAVGVEESGAEGSVAKAAAKAGFTAFLSGLRNRLAKQGVHVVSVLPGFVATRMSVVDGKDELALPKAIQRHPIKPEIEHVDLISVRLGEKIIVDVQLVIVGDVVSGGLLAQEATTLSVEAEATHLPSSFEISIAGLAVGTQVTAADVTLPAGTVLAGDPEQILIIIQEAPTAETLESEGGGGSIAEQAAETAAPTAAP